MSRVILNLDEGKLAELIVDGVGLNALRVCSDDRDNLRFAVTSPHLRLRSVVLGRAALRRLLTDPAAMVKIEYLQRELQLASTQRAEYSYPGKRTVSTCLPLETPQQLASVR